MKWPWQKDPEPNISELISNAVTQALVLNEAAIVGRSGKGGISGGNDNADTLHNIYRDFGYPDNLEFFNYWNMFRRFGIARRGVSLPVDTGWSSVPIVESTNKQFLIEFEKLEPLVSFWLRMRGLDLRQRVGRYGGMFMRVRDGKKPDEELKGKQNGIASLAAMVPLYESQLEVHETDQDPASETFGQPTMYQYSASAPGTRNEKAVTNINIHASRVVPASEGADDGSIYGISSLEAPYNSLLDLRKVIGAGAEGFYKNAAQNIIFKLMDMASAKNNEGLLAKFNEAYDEFSHNRFRRGLWTPGLDAENLQSTLMDPKEFSQNAVNDVAAGFDIPATILIGQQTGRLASTEDSEGFLSTVQSRRMNFMTEMTRDNIDWLIKFGILPAAEYKLVWDDLLARSDEDKLKNADSMASTNEKQFKSGGDAPFTGEEIREAAGFDPEDIEDPEGEGLPDDIDEEENSA